MNIICVDTGVLSIFFSKNVTEPVETLMNNVKQEKTELHILKPVLVETFKHICKLHGIEFASITILSFINKYPIQLIELDVALIIKAGTLKCQNPKTLSYIDCMSIAYALNSKIPFHTTEKTLKKIPNATLQRLKVVEYKF